MASVSVVVPMYNEHDRIADTLHALLRQSRPIDEIIVVDNNSTDDSSTRVAEIAAEHPTVRLISESEPGCYAARAAGYDAATSDIIARTDADTLVDERWAETIVDFFDSEAGRPFSASTGSVSLYDGPPFKIIEKVTQGVAEAQEAPTLVGPNHAIRKSAWLQIRDTLTRRPDVWEDFDISMALKEKGLRIWYTPQQQVSTSCRTQQKSPIANWHYLFGGIRTAKARGDAKSLKTMRIDLPLRFILFTVSWLVFRPWNDRKQTWRPHRLVLPLDHDHGDVTALRD
ncbi:glycosyltransferase [Gordonia humi]|uniref:Glycosyltransferase involved in cell wall biosynthesis n=1 Tax=Gordonia humi TaxID=686429 RepID=A0A840EY38_9ACTN|nr:glycosyltransferase family 2 protein [Gordonia humi]MBB4135248.1 glycosyltransferase involved in cell wall biosynthesis [Gordonia humi]